MTDNDVYNSVAGIQQLLKGAADSQSLALLNNVMAETIGMSMHNAVTAQHNAQMLGSATTTSTCARILSVMGVKAPPPPVPATDPLTPVTPVTPVTVTPVLTPPAPSSTSTTTTTTTT
jgi:hypothetical protein